MMMGVCILRCYTRILYMVANIDLNVNKTHRFTHKNTTAVILLLQSVVISPTNSEDVYVCYFGCNWMIYVHHVVARRTTRIRHPIRMQARLPTKIYASFNIINNCLDKRIILISTDQQHNQNTPYTH